MSELPEMKQYSESKFRFNAKKVFLTYPNLPVGLGPVEALDLLKQKAELRYYLISQERHKEGSYHLHALIEFQTKLDTKDVNFFNLKYYSDRHPNIQKPRNFMKVARYIKKDGNYITNYPKNAEPVWKQILAAETYEEFLEEILWNIGDKLTSYTVISTLKELYIQKNPLEALPNDGGTDRVKKYLEELYK